MIINEYLVTFPASLGLFVCTQLNDFKYCYLSLVILFKIIRFQRRKMIPSIVKDQTVNFKQFSLA